MEGQTLSLITTTLGSAAVTDPADLAKARAVSVKSRGHFRAGFDEFFPSERVIEVGAHVSRKIVPKSPIKKP